MHHSDPNPLSHDHNFLSASHDAHEKRTRYVVALTAAMMVLEIAAGLWTGSMALLADGIHMATHAGALGVAAFAYWFARRHADNPRFTFGTGKVGDLAGFASALVLAIFAVGIAVESIQRIFSPLAIAYTEAIWIAVLGLLVNLASAWLLGADHHHGHDHGHGHGHEHEAHNHHDHDHAHADNNLRSAYFHVLADALTSVLAIAALLAGRYLGWAWMDAAMGIVGALVIARWSWTLLRDTAAVLVDADAGTERYSEVREALEDGDTAVGDLHIWRIGPGKYAVIASVIAADPASPEQYAARLAVHAEYVHITVEVHRCVHEHPHLRAA
ncbi:CDF family Co(II)/Ni(II) efflux transporter DmeF [Porphyrobacter algicida]|uniref:CDF family Co(II)/Ni(II) efflux transporter DmeF n=1 Tax=Qipengyuania algicida TaxID=1836209 RepID=A0A845AL10_9SPHN|nr:CDF family Co(II)/Ni(II) efflux transporter DmeF [Qipengyuania algicida]MXP29853.1 CDF family Co(II)/Ni(II) efflux transporter DmeF [Qipengyuania algicida]